MLCTHYKWILAIPYSVTKLGCYCECLDVLGDRSLIWLSPERLCQSLTNTEMFTANHSIELGVSYGGVGEGTEGAEMFAGPWREQQ